ncbi:MAG: FAD-binding oxidoreductase [Pseudomonadota bacterium]
MSDHARALAAMRAVLGAEGVRADQATLERYAISCSGDGTRALAVAYPVHTGQVVALVDIARAHGLPIYPISTGKNWGYGDACAPTDGQVIIELSRMNRIVHVDPVLCYAVVEAGVTQGQLSAHLRAHFPQCWADCTGAGPDTSLVGNIVERGFGHSPYGDRARHVAGMQVVLANGELLDTGFGHYPNAQARYLFPYGIGPFLDGLFTQSNFGIVTQVGIWLMPAAPCINHFVCRLEDHADIGPVVDALRPLRLDGSLRSVIHIGNDLRVLASAQVSPQPSAALDGTSRAALRARAGVGAWTVSGAVYGSVRQVALARHALRQALRATRARPHFISERKLAALALAAKALAMLPVARSWTARVALGRALLDMNRGIPDARFLAGAYWRRRGGLPADFPAGADPARDGCGMLWLSPILPLRGDHLLFVHALVEPVFAAHGFDLFATYSMVNERSLCAIFSIVFARDDASEMERAKRCQREAFGVLMQAGYVPYRVGLASMAQLDPAADAYWRTVGAIKQALDPAGIMAPGRYAPAPPATRRPASP